jgi:hypothetical protein
MKSFVDINVDNNKRSAVNKLFVHSLLIFIN